MAAASSPSLVQRCAAELLGTFILVLLGCGAVHAAVLTGAQSGLWQVAIVWGVAIMLAAYTVGGVSGAHINPAISVALAAWRRTGWRHVPTYCLAQLAGAFLAAACLFALYEPQLAAKEAEKQVARGNPGSHLTAMCYGEYFPSPGPLAAAPGPYSPAADAELSARVSQPLAFGAEVLGTAVLAFVVFGLSDSRNAACPGQLAPVFVGLTVAGLISIVAPLTQACFNPARDFGPRLFAYLAGWGAAALPGPIGWGWLTVYIVAPTVGALLGGGVYQLVVAPAVGNRAAAMA